MPEQKADMVAMHTIGEFDIIRFNDTVYIVEYVLKPTNAVAISVHDLKGKPNAIVGHRTHEIELVRKHVPFKWRENG